MFDLEQVIKVLDKKKNIKWPIQVNLVALVQDEENLSVKELCRVLKKCPYYITASLELAKHIKIYPDLARVRNRKTALRLVLDFKCNPALLRDQIKQQLEKDIKMYDAISVRSKTRNDNKDS